MKDDEKTINQLLRENEELRRELAEAQGNQQPLKIIPEQLLRHQAQIIDQIHDGVVSTDLEGFITSCNKGAERLLGFTAEEAIGNHISCIYPEEEREFLEQQIIAPSKANGHHEVEVRVRHKSGEVLHVHLALSLLRDNSGQPFGIIGYGVDITARKKAEAELRASEERYRSFFENSLDGILITRPDGCITSANPAACRILNMTEEEICKRGRDGIVDHADSKLSILLEKRSRNKKVRGELTFVLKDGTKLPAELSSTIFKDHHGDVVSIIIFRDITERKQMEEELQRSHDKLELRVQERTAELALALESSKTYATRLELLNNELQEFAFVASHDLQEPLRKVQAFSDRLRSKCEASLGEEGCDYLRRMQSAANRMSTLLSALLSYSRVGTRGKPFVPVDLTRLAEDALIDLEIAVEDADAQVEIGSLPTLEADADQMRQVFQNLFGNALRYRCEGKRPLVQVHGSVESGIAQILVEDNGIGFDEKYLDRIFKPFQRLHGRNSPYEGTGMGLAIIRKITERHGGSITARSVPGAGATFIVTLPVKQSSGKNDQP